MSFNLNCDNCNKFIKRVGVKDIEKMRANEAFICDSCLKEIENIKTQVEAVGNQEITKIKQAIKESQDRLKKVLADRQIQEGRS